LEYIHFSNALFVILHTPLPLIFMYCTYTCIIVCASLYIDSGYAVLYFPKYSLHKNVSNEVVGNNEPYILCDSFLYDESVLRKSIISM